MAISVDTVYQRVLALANKEQRGYITPLEFNLIANQAQMQIFESYFYTKNQRERTEPDRPNDVDETDISILMDAKLSPFSEVALVQGGSLFPSTILAGTENLDVFHTGKVFYNALVCEKVPVNEARRFQRSVRHAYPNDSSGPIYIDSATNNSDIQVYSEGTDVKTNGVTVECFRVPRTVNWSYVVVNEKPLYNANLAVDFELHKAEEDTLVNKILELAGIVINKVGLAQTFGLRDSNKKQTQKI